MNHARVVIGAGYGDEGKGLLTDYLAAGHGPDAIVVRFNGGAQAGHTVHTPGGARHVFSHFGAGSLSGALTYLSRYFVCHPMLFHREREALLAAGKVPKVLVDPRAPVTTPYDVMINQQLEAARGAGRHGSCGVGFGETIEREEGSGYAFRVADLSNASHVRARLRDIRDRYTPGRLSRLGLPPLPPELQSDSILERYLDDVVEFREHVKSSLLAPAVAGKVPIFEGAQGLLLDMDRGCFPHVTRSNTGLANVVQLAREAGVAGLDVCYATRAYVTRHGAGPLAHELDAGPYSSIEDATNIGNPWQGDLRFAWLDLDGLAGSIQADLSDGAGLVRSTTLLVGCLDQCKGPARFLEGGRARCARADTLAARAGARVGVDAVLGSYGPTRNDVTDITSSSARRCA